MINVLLLFYSDASVLREMLSSEAQQRYQLNLLLHHWSLQTWISIFAVANFFIVLHGASVAIKKRESLNRYLSDKLKKIENEKPRIKLREPDTFRTDSVVQTFGDGTTQSVPFLAVRFVNDPLGPYPSAVAKDVRATVNYHRNSDNALLLSINGRWADSDQPSAFNFLQSKSHLLAITFGIGETHTLDIGYRDSQTGNFSAWNNENYSYPGLRCPAHILSGDQFTAKIRLVGEWVDQSFSIRFSLDGDGWKVESA